jgi:HD-like signal output (HDOD) protein
MVAAGILFASFAVLAGWLAYRRVQYSGKASGGSDARIGRPVGAVAFGAGRGAADGHADRHADGHADGDAGSVAYVADMNSRVSERLWRLAFGAPAEIQGLGIADARIRELICAKLQVDTLDPDYFPRRPTLMPQLLRALDDPRAESEKLARIVAHDPVLTGDVLQLANSTVYRTSSAPIESIQRALIVCGVDALRGIVATAMLRPVFRATRSNFPRLPRMLWERTERAARAAESYALELHPQDRFEAQLVVLLNALGPLVVYGAALNAYSRVPRLAPNPELFVELIGALAPEMSRRIARNWEGSPRLVAALENFPGESLTSALHVGELLGTLSFLESQTVVSSGERMGILSDCGLPDGLATRLWSGIRAAA